MTPGRRLVVAIALSVAACATAEGQEQGAEVLFDGATLRGWDGDPAVWSVRDGCIVGSSVGLALAEHAFLIRQGDELADFELSLQVRLEGDNNSGVYYRARRIDGGNRVAGYQCDVHAEPGYFGMLYEDGGRGIVAQHGQRVVFGRDGAPRVTGNGDAGRVDLKQWHTLRIVARGTTVQHWVDGRLAVEVVDDAPGAAARGCLALQVHPGAEMTVWFRALELRRLPPVAVAVAAPPPPPAPLPRWIWDASPQDDEEVFFRRVVALEAPPRAAVLAVTADNHCRVYVNGERVAQSDAWEAPRVVDVQKLLRPGPNVIAVHAWNDGGAAGLCAVLAWTAADGRSHRVATNAQWSCASDDPDGWDAAAFAEDGWVPASVLAELGGGPWARGLGVDAFDVGKEEEPQLPVPAPELTVPAGCTATRVLRVPRRLGSWVCLASDDRGRLYASDQKRGLYRIVPGRLLPSPQPSTIERVDVDLDGCQGLCWAHGALYAVANGARSGLYRLSDGDGDDRLDRVELLRALDGDGEHGPHAVVLAPDCEHLLVLCGNHTRPPELAASRVPRAWGEDVLPLPIDDPNGHAVGITAPGGFVCEVDRDGRSWELLCCGFRNAYDLAVLGNGDVVTFDADMEWDMGLPWYRPTRVLAALSGVDYGWRSGSRKWPADYPDTLPSIVDVGPSSPTGVLAHGAGLLALDWTFGTVHQVDLEPLGAGYRGTTRPFAAALPLPVVDVVAGDGGHYLLTGGRGIPSTLYHVAAGASEMAAGPPSPPALQRRRTLEAFHGRVDARAVALAWDFLGDGDAVLRHAARIAVESQPVAEWRERALQAPAPGAAGAWQSLTALVALARQGSRDDLEPVAAALLRLEFRDLEPSQRIAWLRAHALALMRLGPPTPELARDLAARWSQSFPCGDARADAELCALLAAVDAPLLLERALPLLASLRPEPPPPWAEVADRNAAYGGAIQTMLGAMPPTSQLALAHALCTVRRGWTLEQRQQFFGFLLAARGQKGGASYDGYLGAMIDAAWATCSEQEQPLLADLVGKARAPAPPPHARPPRGPGRAWQLADAVALVRTGLRDRDLAAGRELFVGARCAACHRFAGEGSGVGPDLTSLGNKFTAADVLEAILEPSRVVSDQFAGEVLTLSDGSTLFGRTSHRKDGAESVYEVVTATADARVVRVPASTVVKVERAVQSPMPAGLVDPLNEQELLDLLAFLLSRGGNVGAAQTR